MNHASMQHDHHQSHAHDKHAGHSPEMFRGRFWVCLVLTLPVLLISPQIAQWFGYSPIEFHGLMWLMPFLGTTIFFYGGGVFIRGAVDELKAKLPGMMTLITLAIVAAYVYSMAIVLGLEGGEFFWELATLITIMLLGHWMEMKSVKSAQGALKELAKLLPDEAERITKDGTEKVAVSDLKVGDQLLVRPGGKIPADAVVTSGQSSVNEAMITGESKPVSKTVTHQVIAGTVNGSGSLKLKVTQIGEQTALAGIMRLVAEAQSSHSRSQILADKAAYYLTLIAIIAGLGAFIGWLVAGSLLSFALERMVAVLIIACPHALGLAVPLVTAISTSKAASYGLLVRQRMALERARSIDVVLFDKTGTLTKGEQGVVDVWAETGCSVNQVLGLAAAVESESEHSIAHSILAKAKADKISLPKASNFQSLAGKGVQATVNGQKISVGGPRLLDVLKIKTSESWKRNLEPEIDQASLAGQTVITVFEGNRAIGALAIADVVRPQSQATVNALQAMGVRVAMITGDDIGVAQAVSRQLGIKEYFDRVLPENKVDKVKKLQQDGSRVMMVGDGVNDAPALTQATIGVAIGAGTDVAIESAGIILMRDDPSDVVKIIRLSKSTYRKMVQNLVWATGYNVVAIPLAAGVFASWGLILSPAVGAVLMSVSTVVVALNAQLLRRLNLNNN